jgi:chorismate lyase/3-hydroxybenzoate synthase
VISVLLRDAVSLGADELEGRVAGAYGEIAGVLDSDGRSGGGGEGLLPVRFWNFIPGIHDAMRDGCRLGDGAPAEISRYMVFNAGRYRAIERWRADGTARGSPLGGGIAAATGVGYRGSDLVVHCLAVEGLGRAVENPRQVPAYQYSRRYGPLPPCFARGTLADGPRGPVLLVGGTASVRGEESVHGLGEGTGGLEAQVRETMANLASLIETGLGEDEPALKRLTDVRVYHSRPGDRAELTSLTRGALGPAARIEFVRADICRPELLVEIEGVAGGRPSGVV